jgi:uncharacterized membrane protein YgdD (TMEM256/DUF423 family)
MERRNAAGGTLVTGAALAAIAVAAGAFGAHGLRGMVPADLLLVFETAVRYQIYHAFALLVTGILLIGAAEDAGRRLRQASFAFLAGTILFSGSLYLMALTGIRWPGAITPAGGVCFLAGWGLLASGCWKLRNSGGK